MKIEHKHIKVGSRIRLKEDVEMFSYTYTKGHEFNVVSQSQRGFDLEDDDGNKMGETLFIEDKLELVYMNTEKSINETKSNTPDVKDSYKHSLLDVWAFAEWCASTYVRHNDWWVHRHADERYKYNWKATSELWALWWENYR